MKPRSENIVKSILASILGRMNLVLSAVSSHAAMSRYRYRKIPTPPVGIKTRSPILRNKKNDVSTNPDRHELREGKTRAKICKKRRKGRSKSNLPPNKSQNAIGWAKSLFIQTSNLKRDEGLKNQSFHCTAAITPAEEPPRTPSAKEAQGGIQSFPRKKR